MHLVEAQHGRLHKPCPWWPPHEDKPQTGVWAHRWEWHTPIGHVCLPPSSILPLLSCPFLLLIYEREEGEREIHPNLPLASSRKNFTLRGSRENKRKDYFHITESVTPWAHIGCVWERQISPLLKNILNSSEEPRELESWTVLFLLLIISAQKNFAERQKEERDRHWGVPWTLRGLNDKGEWELHQIQHIP